MTNHCLHCSSIISEKKRFCNHSCSATYNNKGVRRHGRDCPSCAHCGKPTKTSNRKYCSHACFGAAAQKSIEHKRALNALKQSEYRAKKYRVLAPDANKDLIREFYKNRPEGYEVDHIIPLSKGGLHHENNLQYLTKEENRRKNNRLEW